MNIEKLVQQTIIERLSGIAKAHKENETRIAIGNQIATIEFPNDLIDGAIVRIYRKDGTLMSCTEYKNHERHGEGTEYWPGEKIKTQIKYEHDNRIYAKEFDTNGKLRVEKNYKNGRLDGKTTLYNKTGTKVETKYSSGKKKEVTFIRKNGTKSKTEYYGGYWGGLVRTSFYNREGDKIVRTERKKSLWNRPRWY